MHVHRYWISRFGSKGRGKTMIQGVRWPIAIFIVLLSQPFSGVPAATSVFADQDAWLKQAAPGDNFGGEHELSVKNKSGDGERAVFRFDLSSIPPNSTIGSATARFRATNPDNRRINIYRITDEWSEFSVNWGNTANDFDGSEIRGKFTPSSDDAFYSVDLTSLVQDWICGTPNYGLMFIATSNDLQSKFASRESDSQSHRPSMEVVLGNGPSPCSTAPVCTYELTRASGQPGTASVTITPDEFRIEFKSANPNSLYTIWTDHRDRGTPPQLAPDYPLDKGALERGVAPTFATTAGVTSGMGLDPNAVVTDSKGNATLSVSLDYNLLKIGDSPVVGRQLAMQGLNRVSGGWLRVYQVDANAAPSLQLVDKDTGLPRLERSTAQGITIVKHPDTVSHGFTPGVGGVDHSPAFSGDFPAACLQ